LGSFDRVSFSSHLKPFPAGLSRDGWQTKSLDCRQVEYRVDASGRVGRLTPDDSEYFYSDTASFSASCKWYGDNERHYLTMVVANGRLVALAQEGVDDEPELHNRGWDTSESEIR
jgi:hypothetical protein